MIRKATKEDIGAVSAIYEELHDAEEAGDIIIGWRRGVYPTIHTAEAALAEDDLYVYEADGKIMAPAIINRNQCLCYNDAEWSEIVAEADRFIAPDTIILRTVQYGLANYPELDKEGHWLRALDHLHEKYAEGGYLRLWFDNSPNVARLNALREIIKDVPVLRHKFYYLYDSLTNPHLMGCTCLECKTRKYRKL